jgi:hypothetical protein
MNRLSRNPIPTRKSQKSNRRTCVPKLLGNIECASLATAQIVAILDEPSDEIEDHEDNRHESCDPSSGANRVLQNQRRVFMSGRTKH